MIRRRWLLTILSFLLVFLSLQARYVNDIQKTSYPGGKCWLYRVYLTDKKGSPYSLDNPQEFLSARSVERRKRQGLALDSTDLPVSPLYMSTLSERGFEIVGRSKWNNTVLLRVTSAHSLKALKELPFVSSIKKVFTAPDSIQRSNRTHFHKEFIAWGETSEGFYGNAQEQMEKLNGNRLHEAGFLGQGKMIAVFDGGFMNVDRIPVMHELKLAGVADFVVPRSKNVFQEMDHGTKVLSVMAVNVPNIYVGTAPEASFLLVRCEDEATESLAEEDYWVEAAEYADSVGVDIINSSLGYHHYDDKTTSYKYFQQDGETAMISHTASMLAGKGIIHVNSAGNDGMGTWKRIGFPADAKDILTVGAITPQGVNAPFSSIGPTADGRIKPDVVAVGSSAAVVTGRGTIINDTGTSFATPQVSGLVACLWQALPEKTALEIIELVRQSGDNVATPDNIYGYGVPDFWKAYQKGKMKN